MASTTTPFPFPSSSKIRLVILNLTSEEVIRKTRDCIESLAELYRILSILRGHTAEVPGQKDSSTEHEITTHDGLVIMAAGGSLTRDNRIKGLEKKSEEGD
jgi:hypothetical protein